MSRAAASASAVRAWGCAPRSSRLMVSRATCARSASCACVRPWLKRKKQSGDGVVVAITRPHRWSVWTFPVGGTRFTPGGEPTF